MWVHRFKVRGKGTFPFDMLRYDQCFPTSSKDATMFVYPQLDWEVKLTHYDRISSWKPCISRWGSFIVKVIEIEKPFKI